MPPQGADDRATPKDLCRMRRTAAPGVMNGARYIESLRDGREVWLHGEKSQRTSRNIRLSPTSSAPSPISTICSTRSPTQDVMTYVDGDGVRSSVSYMPPTSPAELLQTASQYRAVDRAQLRHARPAAGFLRGDDCRLLRRARRIERAACGIWRQRRALSDLRAPQRSRAVARPARPAHGQDAAAKAGSGPLPAHCARTRRRRGRARRAVQHARPAQQ